MLNETSCGEQIKSKMLNLIKYNRKCFCFEGIEVIFVMVLPCETIRLTYLAACSSAIVMNLQLT